VTWPPLRTGPADLRRKIDAIRWIPRQRQSCHEKSTGQQYESNRSSRNGSTMVTMWIRICEGRTFAKRRQIWATGDAGHQPQSPESESPLRCAMKRKDPSGQKKAGWVAWLSRGPRAIIRGCRSSHLTSTNRSSHYWVRFANCGTRHRRRRARRSLIFRQHSYRRRLTGEELLAGGSHAAALSRLGSAQA